MGWMKTMMGPKKNGHRATNRLEARVDPELKRMFQRAADLQGVTLSDFLITSVRCAAMKTLEEHDVIRLRGRDSVAFASALLAPSAPNERLKAAAKRYRRLMSAS
jgi:uncharacterized protein (DUF1778 family)